MWGWELLKGELKNIAFLKGKETKLNKVTIILDGVKQMIKQWSKYISGNKELAIAIQILKEIKKANYYSLIVGGTVRDIVLGTSIYDIDLTTNMPTIKLEKIFKTHDIGKSKDFGILVIEKEGYNFEISTFRQDGKYLDGRRPETVSPVSSFKEDVLRRDFTINALGLTDNGEIIDHVDGINDIKNKVIRTVGNPYERFEEDYVRMIRAARFGSIEGFKIIDETQRAIKKMASLINNTTPERIRLELIKAADKLGKMFAKFIVTVDLNIISMLQ
jgi:tRNA nucleotidyltransferase (CCA-adding enzyme)